MFTEKFMASVIMKYLTVYSVVISSKVHDYLKSSSWETRIAAGQAVSAIARNVPKWNKKIPIKQG